MFVGIKVFGDVSPFVLLRTSKIVPRLNVLIFEQLGGSKWSYFVLKVTVQFEPKKTTKMRLLALWIDQR